jgi:hypothetical protein
MRTTRSFEKQAVQPLETHTFINVVRHDKHQYLHVFNPLTELPNKLNSLVLVKYIVTDCPTLNRILNVF